MAKKKSNKKNLFTALFLLSVVVGGLLIYGSLLFRVSISMLTFIAWFLGGAFLMLFGLYKLFIDN